MIDLRNTSIKTKLTAYSVITVVFISVFISLASYKASEIAMQKQAGQLVSTSVEQIMKRTDLFLKNIHTTALTMTFNSDFVGLLWSDQFDYTKNFTQVSRFIKYSLLINSVNSYIHSIYIYDLKHMVIVSSNGFGGNIKQDDENYRIIEESFINKKFYNSPYLWIGIRSLKAGENVTTFMTPIIDQTSAALYGVLIININVKSITSSYANSSLAKSGDFFIVDPQGKIISTIDNDLIGSKSDTFEQKYLGNSNSFLTKRKGKEYIETYFKSNYNNWKYISVIPMDNLMKDNIKVVKNMFLLIAFIAASLFVILSFAFNSFFYKPVKALISGIRESVNNREEINLKVNRKDEIGFIFNSVNEILKENSKLIKEVYEQKISSKNSELRLLQSQINPHFLYNSLDTAVWMIKLDDKDNAAQIIESLIQLFRLSLEKINEIITVREELENLNNYLTIQKIRYEEKLKVNINVEEDIMECKMLKLLLQPLVENSIYHGIGKNKRPGNINILGKKSGDLLKFVVEDNGVGIPEDRLENIRRIINSNEKDNDNFYALQNINKRVKLYYGEQYGITIESEENEWAIVTLVLPNSSC